MKYLIVISLLLTGLNSCVIFSQQSLRPSHDLTSSDDSDSNPNDCSVGINESNQEACS